MHLNDKSIVLSGAAGQGIKTVEKLLVGIFKNSGHFVFSFKEYMSRIRGGNNTTQIRVASEKVNAPVDGIDLLIPLNPDSINRLRGRISKSTLIVGDKDNIDDEFLDRDNSYTVAINGKAKEIGGQIYSNVIAAAIAASLFGIDLEIIESLIEKTFSMKGEEVVKYNLKAASAGAGLAGQLDAAVMKGLTGGKLDQYMLVNGSEAMGMGAVAGGCNFIAAYPMSPSTGVFSFLSEQAEAFGIIAEQAEDEIAAINMVIGSWYAGGRGLANTSGGGFALMEEGVSLSGMLETPVVIHLAQRPGPATGLPTRTEQGDMELAIYSGHGEFPKAVFTPGTLEDLYQITSRAFNLADLFQIPVIILTDQYLLDSYQCIERFDAEPSSAKNHFIETLSDYERYRFVEDGISPRGIPGFGKGFVCVDSDEHDQQGHITEDLEIRSRIVDKRLKKLEHLRNEALEPVLFGNHDYKTLILGCGSTCHIILEALQDPALDDHSFLYIRQIHPFDNTLKDYLLKSERNIVVENNATSQLGRLITVETGVNMDDRILKYNGLPFTVEELRKEITNRL